MVAMVAATREAVVAVAVPEVRRGAYLGGSKAVVGTMAAARAAVMWERAAAARAVAARTVAARTVVVRVVAVLPEVCLGASLVGMHVVVARVAVARAAVAKAG